MLARISAGVIPEMMVRVRVGRSVHPQILFQAGEPNSLVWWHADRRRLFTEDGVGTNVTTDIARVHLLRQIPEAGQVTETRVSTLAGAFRQRWVRELKGLHVIP